MHKERPKGGTFKEIAGQLGFEVGTAKSTLADLIPLDVWMRLKGDPNGVTAKVRRVQRESKARTEARCRERG